MNKHALPFLAPVLLAMPAAASAQALEAEIVVIAPSGLGEKEARDWADLNQDARKLGERMAKLRKEMRDDESDVAEARRDFEDAERKLQKEQEDLDETARDIAENERDMQNIQRRRDELRANRRAPGR